MAINDTRNLIYESDESLIYLAEQAGKKTIVKVLRSLSPDPDLLLRLNNEYEFTKELDIPGIRKALKLENEDGHLAITLEFVEGVSLAEAFIGKNRPIPEILHAFIQIADILGKLHLKGVIHKDINENNIMWSEKEKKATLIDFSISNRLDLVTNHLGNPDKIKGTLTHMSPEQTGRVNRKIDSRSDLYSLGVTMYHVLTGKLPFESRDSLELVHFHIAKSVPILHLENKLMPEMFSKIVGKLMAKNAEDRYQSAFGLKYDLEKCYEQLLRSDKVKDFETGANDFSGKFQIPQKLYGRLDEVNTLLQAFDRVSKGSTELFMVSGYSGVGKTALISEIYKPVTERRGYFVEGKFDQYQRNIPYYAIAHAFTEFCQLILTEDKVKLDNWRQMIQESVGENGRVLTEIIPALENIIGPQPEVATLESLEALNRLNNVFQKFISVIGRADHPFVLFCDDLQWADTGSINLIKLLVTEWSNPYLLVIGAYRDNEVQSGHPLLKMLIEAASEKAIINTIELKPLREEHVALMIKEALQIDDSSVHNLTELVFFKTMGNAFFTIEFLKSLNQLGLVKYNFSLRKWDVNLDAIRKRGITSNVVELLVSKIKELPAVTQNVLKLASCIGGLFDLEILATLYGKNKTETFADLYNAIEEGLLSPVGENYQYVEILAQDGNFKIEIEFSHDRVQQAAYSLMKPKDREKTHLKIGRLLLEQHEKEDAIFDIVNHYNEGISLISSKEEKSRIAALNLQAATQARNSSVYVSAFNYVTVARNLTEETAWDTDYDFALKLEKTAAEIEYLNGNFPSSIELIQSCLQKVKTPAEKSDLYFMLMQIQSNLAQYQEAISSSRQGLKLLDFDFPERDAAAALIPAEMGKAITYFTENGIEGILQKPDMTDGRLLAIMNLLDNLSPNTYVAGESNLWILHVLYKVNLSIEHGLTPQGGYAFTELGIIFNILGNHALAYPSTALAMRIAEKFKEKSPRHLCRSGHLHINYNLPWTKPIQETIKLNPVYHQLSLDCGEMIYAGYMSMYSVFNSYFLGKESLRDLIARMPESMDLTRRIKHALAYGSLRALYLVINNLSGQTSNTDSFDIEILKENDFIEEMQATQNLYSIAMLHLFKSQAFYFKGEYDQALVHLKQTEAMSAFMAGNAGQGSTYNMLHALTLIALAGKDPSVRDEYTAKAETFRDQMRSWSDNNPSNFEHKYLLIEAELCRLKGDGQAALDHYTRALASAVQYEFEREQALIHLRSAEYWIGANNPLYAQPHLEKARAIFEKADYRRLVEQLDRTYGRYFSARSKSISLSSGGFNTVGTNTIETPIEAFDLLSVMKASHALSGEILLDKLIDKMLRISIENAGGQRAVLLMQSGGKWKVEADLNVEDRSDPTMISMDLENAKDIPVSIINYVIRTQSEVISDNKELNKIFERDAYFKSQNPSSYLCLPLTYKGQTNGILYVEHKSSAEAFTTERLNVLRMLTSQMAVSLENANLYNKQFELIKAYQRFVPLDFISTLGHQSILQVKLGDHIKQEMTVMFCDIRSYSAMSEGMTTEENFNFINAYLKRVGPLIQKNNGFINHYYGDGFIALFKHDPEDALHAAMEIIAAIEVYNEERVTKGQMPILLGFGVHTGPVMMGIIGDDERNDANVISDAVNTSSRLEGLTKIFGSSVILSGKTMELIEHPDLFKLRYLGRIQVKGKEDVMSVYEMFGADNDESKEKKSSTLENFNRGLKDYFSKNFAEAALSLKKVLDENPSDKTARRYLQNSARFMVEGVPKDWDGVEQMTEK